MPRFLSPGASDLAGQAATAFLERTHHTHQVLKVLVTATAQRWSALRLCWMLSSIILCEDCSVQRWQNVTELLAYHWRYVSGLAMMQGCLPCHR